MQQQSMHTGRPPLPRAPPSVLVPQMPQVHMAAPQQRAPPSSSSAIRALLTASQPGLSQHPTSSQQATPSHAMLQPSACFADLREQAGKRQ